MVEAAGFQVRSAVLFDRFTELKGDQGLKDWIRMFIKTPFHTVPGPDEQEEIIDHGGGPFKEGSVPGRQMVCGLCETADESAQDLRYRERLWG